MHVSNFNFQLRHLKFSASQVELQAYASQWNSSHVCRFSVFSFALHSAIFVVCLLYKARLVKRRWVVSGAKWLYCVCFSVNIYNSGGWVVFVGRGGCNKMISSDCSDIASVTTFFNYPSHFQTFFETTNPEWGLLKLLSANWI